MASNDEGIVTIVELGVVLVVGYLALVYITNLMRGGALSTTSGKSAAGISLGAGTSSGASGSSSNPLSTLLAGLGLSEAGNGVATTPDFGDSSWDIPYLPTTGMPDLPSFPPTLTGDSGGDGGTDLSSAGWSLSTTDPGDGGVLIDDGSDS